MVGYSMRHSKRFWKVYSKTGKYSVILVWKYSSILKKREQTEIQLTFPPFRFNEAYEKFLFNVKMTPHSLIQDETPENSQASFHTRMLKKKGTEEVCALANKKSKSDSSNVSSKWIIDTFGLISRSKSISNGKVEEKVRSLKYFQYIIYNIFSWFEKCGWHICTTTKNLQSTRQRHWNGSISQFASETFFRWEKNSE